MIKAEGFTLGRFLRLIVIIAAIAAAFFVVDSLSGVLLPFAIACLLAYLINPLVDFYQHKLRVKYRSLSIVAAFATILIVLFGVVMLIVPPILGEISTLQGLINSYIKGDINSMALPYPVEEYVRDFFARNDIKELLSNGINLLSDSSTDKIAFFAESGINIIKYVFNIFLVTLYLFFILLDYEKLAEEWKTFLPKRWRGFATKLSDDLAEGMSQYFRGQALVATIVGILLAIGFSIIDFPIALAFGIFVGVLNLVPYLQLISLVPMALLSLIKAADTGDSAWVIFLSGLAVMCVVQVIQDLVLVPKIMGRRMNLHPAVILLSLSIWGSLLGVLGMIVALPLTTLIIGYVKRYHELYDDISLDSSIANVVMQTKINSKDDGNDDATQVLQNGDGDE